MLNVDLHCHSNVSDGVLSPAAVAQYARKSGVDVWGLTDHDEVGGIAAARTAALAVGMRFIPGVEISITWANHTVHIVGLCIDETNPVLLGGLGETRSGRDGRAREMAAQLARAGIPGAYEGALKFVGNPDLMSRTHFARFLVDCGVCASIPEVFRKYLTEGKPGYVPHRWASLKDAVGWITGAHGVAVIAHPGRYNFTANEEYALFTEFKEHGGRAVEVVTGSHTRQEFVKYAETAKEFGLAASRGSDFHSPTESRTDLGTLPFLPGDLTPVWELLAHRIQQ